MGVMLLLQEQPTLSKVCDIQRRPTLTLLRIVDEHNEGRAKVAQGFF